MFDGDADCVRCHCALKWVSSWQASSLRSRRSTRPPRWLLGNCVDYLAKNQRWGLFLLHTGLKAEYEATKVRAGGGADRVG